ncbi:BRO family protein [Mycobacteroides abscessus]|uniref:BRO family protein n=1 Tax=Mycobacteroides abscessus TaxID=36809 RepID=UPI000C259E87|nr:BRO family protein [Mycobacteroides abscessus]MBN7377775.1 phage antirepressor KilAC domain-containing protein [Mycobacteroides abscessus subsp. massiliense]
MSESSSLLPSNGSSVESFEFHGQPVRFVIIDSEPHPILTDLCKVLGLTNPSMVAQRIDQAALSQADIRSGGQMRRVTVVNESGMYEVIFRSDKPEAVEFRRFVTGTVLPQIRRTGSYNGAPALSGPELVATALIEASKMIEVKDERIAELEERAEKDRPAIEYVNTHVVVDDDVMLIEDWGRTYGLTKPQAFALVRDEKDLIYQKSFERWSETQQCKVTEIEYRPRAGKASFTWFDVKEQRNAPRRNNGQARKTLYVKAIHAVDLARLVGLLPNIEAVSA